MRVDELSPPRASHRARRRLARGIGGKGGKTAGRGTKGQKARNTVPRGFEGGQMPLKQRVPKLKGFNNPFRVEYHAINLDTLQELSGIVGGGVVDPQVLIDHGLLRKDAFVKILARGELSAKLDVTAHAVSKAAEAAIMAAGGTVTLVPLPFRAENRAGRPPVKGNQFTNR